MEAILSNLPFALFFLLCPLMMLFMHRGGGRQHRGEEANRLVDRSARRPIGSSTDRLVDRSKALQESASRARLQ